jgi:uncharacterized repeat protein (TIGR03837 family)
MLWDIFCRVIDNYGDIGVCWRLCRDLAARGHGARLWVDDPTALAWMAPDGCPPSVEVRHWSTPLLLPAQLAVGDVLVEAFGCEPAPEFVNAYALHRQRTGAAAAWLNLEYLSAEGYVQRSHRLPSPVLSGPGAGLTKHFFYPGFSAATGGLLREQNRQDRQAHFDACLWLRQHGIDAGDGARRIALFCYHPPALTDLLDQLAKGPGDSHLLVTHGRASEAVRKLLRDKAHVPRGWNAAGRLQVTYLPRLSQDDFDHLLWASDLNFVRGEDSLVRALWAGKPFVWQIYPQDDGAHLLKLQALQQALDMPASLRQFHASWNSDSTPPLPPLLPHEWQTWASQARAQQLALPDLTSQLVSFARGLLEK